VKNRKIFFVKNNLIINHLIMQKSMQIQGIITRILPLQTGTTKSGSEWAKQGYVLLTKERYAKLVYFELWGKAVDTEAAEVGQEVVAYLNVESREWGGRFYTELSAWRVERVAHDVVAEVNAAAAEVEEKAAEGATPVAEVVATPVSDTDGGFPF
jgi:hypothetical protein